MLEEETSSDDVGQVPPEVKSQDQATLRRRRVRGQKRYSPPGTETSSYYSTTTAPRLVVEDSNGQRQIPFPQSNEQQESTPLKDQVGSRISEACPEHIQDSRANEQENEVIEDANGTTTQEEPSQAPKAKGQSFPAPSKHAKPDHPPAPMGHPISSLAFASHSREPTSILSSRKSSTLGRKYSEKNKN